jgi:hypothetical protein
MDRIESYPFSDLSPELLQSLVDKAKAERALAVRRVFRSLFRACAKRHSGAIECRPHTALRVSHA